MVSGRNKIAVLPPDVQAQIAAGEVIERPASVVKELVENALDAGARSITVAVEGGGLVRITVIDDGSGMSPDDLELAAARHATSKIASAADLESVATLGFRGEALAGIAAVADLSVVSRTAEAVAGTSIRWRAGEVVARSPAAAPGGTRVEVCDLFTSTPARLRFLRSATSESAAVARVVAELAIGSPGVAFSCRIDGRATLRAPGGTLREALRASLGPRAERDLLDVAAHGDVVVRGAISAPHAHRAGRGGLVLFVNGRRVHNRALISAVEESYRGLIPAGRHPYGAVLVEMDPLLVDVNVHPTKREVRFRDERALFSAIQRACWTELRAAPLGEHDARVAPSVPWQELEGRMLALQD